MAPRTALRHDGLIENPIAPGYMPSDLHSYLQLFADHGDTDVAYAVHHWPRYNRTKEEILRTRPLPGRARVLDVGAHWLHQTVLYATDGCAVTALDLPVTLEQPNVRSMAEALDIRLAVERDLENPTALADVPDDHFDLILFTEIIEHITFNPVAMWREFYRVLKAGGRIVVTTPNYYARRGRLWDMRRFAGRFGGGLDVAQILALHTHAHHWKEYSLRELVYYFSMLSPDFNCIKAAHLEEYSESYLGVPASRFGRWLERRLPLLRPALHLEAEIREKQHGVRIEPHW